MPSTVWFASGQEIKNNVKYSYDKCGNITEIRVNGDFAVRYAYDNLNRLIREDNKLISQTMLYAYDGTGNIISKRTTAFTLKTDVEECEFDTYEYGYIGDRLISLNGEKFEYNALGNPTKYRGKTATWQYGKLLASYNGVTFAYDGLGRRTGKNDVTFTYDSDGRLLKQSNGLEFVYDNAGVVGVKYNGAQYFYRKDVQGNIIAILDNNGAVVVNYIYDAWGNHAVVDNSGNDVTSGIGVLNPFRYRGYYYDTETELYYLQTRYYDPEIGRFISQDSLEYADPETINGLNLYAYCGNNPVMNVDPTGTWSWSKFWGWVVAALGAVAAVVAVVAGTVFTGGLLGAVLVGAGTGALLSMGGSIIAQGGFANANPWNVVSAGITGAVIGAISGFASYGFGVIGSSIGEGLGTAFGNATHLASGIKFGKIFNSSTLSTIGNFLGNILGGLVGGTGANYYANKFFGKDLDYGEMIKQGIEGEFPSWLIRFFKWL